MRQPRSDGLFRLSMTWLRPIGAESARKLALCALLVWPFVCQTAIGQTREEDGVLVHGVITTSRHSNTYTFNAVAGQYVWLRIGDKDRSDKMDPWFHVTAPNGAQVIDAVNIDVNCYNSGNCWYNDLFFLAPSTGVYKIVVRAGAYDVNGVGPYDLDGAKNGSASGGTLANGGTRFAQITPGDLDSYTFDAAAGETVWLRLGDANLYDGMGASFRVLAPNGVSVDSAGEYTDLTFVAAASGTYTVIVGGGGLRSGGTIYVDAGPYDLHFAKRGANSGGALPAGGSRSGFISAGGLSSHNFYAAAGEAVWLRIGDPASDKMQPRFKVISPTGALVSSTPSAPPSETLNDLIFVARLSGVYTVVVAASGINTPNFTGPYDLHLAKSGVSQSGELTRGSVRLGEITFGGLNSYSVKATAGETFRVRVSALDSLARMEPVARIFSPTGAQVGYGNQAIKAAESGTYTVVVADNTTFSGINDVGPYEISFDAPRKAFSYAALGDSYSSGEGLKPYLGANDVWYWLIGCHRSDQAYSFLVKLPWDNVPIAKRQDTQFDFFACSGAVTANIPPDGEPEQGEPPQMWSGNTIDASRDLVTVTIGGNDAQWVRMVGFCLAHPHCQDIKPFAPHTDFTLSDLAASILVAHAGININNVHQLLKDATPNAATVVFGYPILVSGKECPALAILGLPSAKLSADEQTFLRRANVALNDVIAASAATVGLHFIPVAQAFENHEVCDEQENWVNGIVLSNPPSTMHPTARGQAEYARLFNEYMAAASIVWPFGYLPNGLPRNPSPLGVSSANAAVAASSATDDAASGAAATRSAMVPFSRANALAMRQVVPKFGDLAVRPDAAPAGCAGASGVIAPGSLARVQGSGFQPGEGVSLALTFNAVDTRWGTATADANGAINVTLQVPEGLAVGTHGYAEAHGAGANGAGLLLMSLVRVEASATLDGDGDGDGIVDICDNCTAIANADQTDSDRDGYGDRCDADFDNNGIVNTLDLAILKSEFGRQGDNLLGDLDGNFTVNALDLALFKSLFGKKPGPSGFVK